MARRLAVTVFQRPRGTTTHTFAVGPFPAGVEIVEVRLGWFMSIQNSVHIGFALGEESKPSVEAFQLGTSLIDESIDELEGVPAIWIGGGQYEYATLVLPVHVAGLSGPSWVIVGDVVEGALKTCLLTTTVVGEVVSDGDLGGAADAL